MAESEDITTAHIAEGELQPTYGPLLSVWWSTSWRLLCFVGILSLLGLPLISLPRSLTWVNTEEHALLAGAVALAVLVFLLGPLTLRLVWQLRYGRGGYRVMLVRVADSAPPRRRGAGLTGFLVLLPVIVVTVGVVLIQVFRGESAKVVLDIILVGVLPGGVCALAIYLTRNQHPALQTVVAVVATLVAFAAGGAAFYVIH